MSMNDAFAALVGFGAGFAALLIYHFTIVRPALAQSAALLAVHDTLIGGGTGAADRLGMLEGRADRLAEILERVSGRAEELEALARTDVSRVGFVRYDAFDNTGSELSYALALLNREGDGVVVSSIYSRTDTRTYGKAVERYKAAVNASDEELRAIELARGRRDP